ncbi:sulfurtransferase TusA family protein [Acetobacter sp. AN02]|uniref:sulfurtransferase TusA family protein n=1 Tax=Acetobacter sp. AN02 TaxID=2894186 RepID=UPI0024345372|nr:sulfurtransferase TusA family protein [Acetobacter sp. AN02]MDG6094061.1 sulfurtransferase TusA family protein [Acetobacter sp. AN02]
MPEITQTLDVTADICPMTFVRTRLALDRLNSGDILAVRLRGEDPLRNISRSATALGHTLTGTSDLPDGVTELLIRKA